MALVFEIVPEFPKRLIKGEDVNLALEIALDRAAEVALKELRRTTTTWKTQVEFTVQRTHYQRRIRTTNQIWNWVDRGTPPHDIEPKKKKFLQFQTGYQRKTVPGILDSFTGGSYGAYRRTKFIEHPGIKPRKFREAMQDLLEERLKDEVELAVLQALGRIQF